MAFRKPGMHKKGIKFLAYGDYATGKTYFMLTFPGIALNDSESGTAHYENGPITIAGQQYSNLRLIETTADLETLEENLQAILDGEYDGEIQTFAIDSETKFYSSMQVGALEVEERRARKKGEDAEDQIVSRRQWGRIRLLNMRLQQAKLDLSARGIHVVSVAQAADEYDKKQTDKIVGQRPDMYKNVRYDYDVVLHFFTKTGQDGKPRFFARVLKDRTGTTQVGDEIENCTYSIWAPYADSQQPHQPAQTSYRQDMETTRESMTSDADKADALTAGWKEAMKALNASGNKAAVGEVTAYMKQQGLDIKTLAQQPPAALQKLADFTARQSAA